MTGSATHLIPFNGPADLCDEWQAVADAYIQEKGGAGAQRLALLNELAFVLPGTIDKDAGLLDGAATKGALADFIAQHGGNAVQRELWDVAQHVGKLTLDAAGDPVPTELGKAVSNALAPFWTALASVDEVRWLVMPVAVPKRGAPRLPVTSEDMDEAALVAAAISGSVSGFLTGQALAAAKADNETPFAEGYAQAVSGVCSQFPVALNQYDPTAGKDFTTKLALATQPKKISGKLEIGVDEVFPQAERFIHVHALADFSVRLQALNAEWQQVMRLRSGFEGPPLTRAEVAQQLGMTAENVQQKESHARALLRKPRQPKPAPIIADEAAIRSSLMQMEPAQAAGKLLRFYREQQLVSPELLEQRTGINCHTIDTLERGRTDALPKYIDQLFDGIFPENTAEKMQKKIAVLELALPQFSKAWLDKQDADLRKGMLIRAHRVYQGKTLGEFSQSVKVNGKAIAIGALSEIENGKPMKKWGDALVNACGCSTLNELAAPPWERQKLGIHVSSNQVGLLEKSTAVLPSLDKPKGALER